VVVLLVPKEVAVAVVAVLENQVEQPQDVIQFLHLAQVYLH
jgi:hypothetical protein